MNKQILLSTPTMHTEEMQFVQEAFDRNWIAPLGFNCDGFEKEMCEYLAGQGYGGPVQGLCLSSGTAALHMAVKLAGIEAGDVVLCSDLTFAASANAVTYEGAVPVFVDCEKDTWNMDPAALEKAFQKYPNAKAVLLVDLYGTPAKMEKILALCEKYGAVLIEDAAEALGATYRGQPCGTFGAYNALSFNGNKIITTSGGGMLMTKSAADREKALFWATQSREPAPWYQHEEIGYNYRLSNVLAGIGRGQLLHLEEHRQKKEQIYRSYARAFEGLPLTMNPYAPDTSPNFWLSCALMDETCPVTPAQIIAALRAENIEARHIWKPMHMQPVFEANDFITDGEQPAGEEIFRRGVCLPSDIKMTEEDIQRVIRIVERCFA